MQPLRQWQITRLRRNTESRLSHGTDPSRTHLLRSRAMYLAYFRRPVHGACAGLKTGSGKRRRRRSQWPSVALAAEGDVVWAAAWNGLYRIEKGRLTRAALEEQPLGIVRLTAGRLFAGGPKGLWEREGNEWRAVSGQFPHSLTDIAAVGDSLWIATQQGLFQLRHGEARRIFAPHDIASGAVRSLTARRMAGYGLGRAAASTFIKFDKRVIHFGGAEGLPCTDVRRLKFGSKGVLWAATARGLGRYDGSHWMSRDSLRWLPSDEVRDVAVAADGTAYVATTTGLAILKQKKMTLADKADHYKRLVRARHVRPPGLVEHCILKRAGDLSSHAPTDTDNDGLFTGLYVGAESLRYAVTRSKEAADNARESYRGMEFLQTVTDTPGFVARTVIPSDWAQMADRNRTYTPQQIAGELIDRIHDSNV